MRKQPRDTLPSIAICFNVLIFRFSMTRRYDVSREPFHGRNIMTATVTKRNGNLLTIELTIELGGSIENHLDLMNYGSFVARCFPIGSGVTEAACKTIVKARCGISGAGWSHEGVGMILTLRTLNLSEGNGDSFWAKISRYGIPYARQFGKITETTSDKQ